MLLPIVHMRQNIINNIGIRSIRCKNIYSNIIVYWKYNNRSNNSPMTIVDATCLHILHLRVSCASTTAEFSLMSSQIIFFSRHRSNGNQCALFRGRPTNATLTYFSSRREFSRIVIRWPDDMRRSRCNNDWLIVVSFQFFNGRLLMGRRRLS